MFKKLISMIGVFCLLLSLVAFSSAASTELSFLDEMTVEELTELKAEIERRIEAKTRSSVPLSDFGMWEIKNYVDEFKNPTDQQYIRNKSLITGTFSNSAVNNRELKVRFLIDESGVSLMLYEYGDSLVKNSYSKSKDYKVTMQDGNGKKTTLIGTMYSAGDRINFNLADSDRINYALRHDSKVSFYIVDWERKTNTYLFTIDNSSYFSNVYMAFFGYDAQPLDAKQEIYPSVYNEAIAAECATQLPDGMLSWQLKEETGHKGTPYFLSGTVVASKNDDQFYIDIGDQIIYVDFTEAYNKKTQSSASVPIVGDQISFYCTYKGNSWDFDYKKTLATFILGLNNK